jgi:hypothetical protein
LDNNIGDASDIYNIRHYIPIYPKPKEKIREMDVRPLVNILEDKRNELTTDGYMKHKYSGYIKELLEAKDNFYPVGKPVHICLGIFTRGVYASIASLIFEYKFNLSWTEFDQLLMIPFGGIINTLVIFPFYTKGIRYIIIKDKIIKILENDRIKEEKKVIIESTIAPTNEHHQ